MRKLLILASLFLPSLGCDEQMAAMQQRSFEPGGHSTMSLNQGTEPNAYIPDACVGKVPSAGGVSKFTAMCLFFIKSEKPIE